MSAKRPAAAAAPKKAGGVSGDAGEALLLSDSTRYAELEKMLLRESRLPGPRGNLELAARFAEAAGRQASDPLWRLLESWLALSPEQAPVNDPREFLPFCALLAAAETWAGHKSRRRAIAAQVRVAANDPRWRLREGVAQALQRIGYADPQGMRGLIAALASGRPTLLELRAIVAALADPPLLGDPENVALALDRAEAILASVAATGAAERKSCAFKALEQGLSYALSVFVAQAPQPGFALLRRWATCGDANIKRILEHNLGKARLTRRFPMEIARVRDALADTQHTQGRKK
ncbi:MAG: HEAT repeat domain-containing protein [Deltaproteobacteria bacterium]|nr:HEAT repeat domain-containing protein [Deltaproteobacteria bacterium]